jgi:hypothetical protein
MRHRQVARVGRVLEDVVTTDDPILDPSRILEVTDQIAALHW